MTATDGEAPAKIGHRRAAGPMRADQVVVMDDGRVVARGTAKELLKSSPVFREMWADAAN